MRAHLGQQAVVAELLHVPSHLHGHHHPSCPAYRTEYCHKATSNSTEMNHHCHLETCNLGSLHSIINQFSMCKSMARVAVQEVCCVIQDILMNCIICLGNPHKLITSFHQMGFLNCLGAVNDTHIPTLCSPQSSVIFQHQGLFPLCCSAGHHGPPWALYSQLHHLGRQ